MSEREDHVRLQHMLDASRQAIAFIQGRGRKDLDQLWRIVSADLPALVPVLERALGIAKSP